jgi:hypothetical protein
MKLELMKGKKGQTFLKATQGSAEVIVRCRIKGPAAESLLNSMVGVTFSGPRPESLEQRSLRQIVVDHLDDIVDSGRMGSPDPQTAMLTNRVKALANNLRTDDMVGS